MFRNKKFLLIFSVLVLGFGVAVFVLKSSTVDAFGGGDGSSSYPYRISTCNELQAISDNPSADYVLAGDIDCSLSSGWNSGAGFAPIPAFTGTLDGRNHTVSGLTIVGTSGSQGVFSSITGTVENINFTTLSVTVTGGSSSGIGGLAGSTSGATINNVSISGNVTGPVLVGGLIGEASGTAIEASSFTGNVTDTSAWGAGLAGFLIDSTVDNSFANVTFSGQDVGGGITSQIIADSGQSAEITNSYVVGTVNDANYTAALAAFVDQVSGGTITISNDFTVVNSFNGMNPRAVSQFNRNEGDNPTISNVYFDQTAADTSDCGIGLTTECIAVNTDGTDGSHFKNTSTALPLNAWGFSGGSPIWEKTVDYPALSPAVLTDLLPLSAPSVPQNLAANPTGTYPEGIDVTWDAPADNGHSGITSYTLKYKLDSDGSWTTVNVPSGTEEFISGYHTGQVVDIEVIATNSVGDSDPTTVLQFTVPSDNTSDITTCAQLQAVQVDPTASYTLMHDIDCSMTSGWNGGEGFIPITDFTGHLDGQGYHIHGLNIDRSGANNQGLFANIDSGADVRNISFSGGVIVGQNDVGALAGNVYGGTIYNIFSDVNINGGSYVGGIIGNVDVEGADANISNLTGNGEVDANNLSGGNNIGGVIGDVYSSDGTVTLTSMNGNAYVGLLNMDVWSVGGVLGGLDQESGSVVAVNGLRATNNVQGFAEIGGVIGYTYATNSNDPFVNPQLTMTNLSAVGTEEECGIACAGVIGDMEAYGGATATLNNSYSTGAVNNLGGTDTGGLIGYSDSDGPGMLNVNTSFSGANVLATNAEVGGLVGYDEGASLNITDSYSTGDIQGTTDVGGIAGYTSGNLTNVYATGQIAGTNQAGGIAGFVDSSSTVQNVFTTSPILAGDGDFGAAFGNEASPSISGVYYDVTATGMTNCNGGGDDTGCNQVNGDGTDSNYFKGNTINAPLGTWDFGTTWARHFHALPTLAWYAPAPNTEISTCAQLQAIQDAPWADYELTQNIDCSGSGSLNDGAGFQPITDFTGSLTSAGDNQFSINDLGIAIPSNVGIFSDTENASITNIKIGGDTGVVGTGDSGMLVSDMNGGLINNVVVSGEVDQYSPSYHAGGLVGVLTCDGSSPNATISNSSFHGYVLYPSDSDAWGYGGIVGWINSYGSGCSTTLNGDSVSSSNLIPISGGNYGSDLGGIAGEVDTSTEASNSVTIENSFTNSMQIGSGFDAIGGLVGYSGAIDGSSQSITNSYTYGEGEVSASDDGAGGLVGSMFGHVQLYRDSADIVALGANEIGGLVGSFNSNGEVNVVNIDQSYTGVNSRAIDSENDGKRFGGLVGGAYDINVSNSYSKGHVESSNDSDTGGLFGSFIGDLSNSYAAGTVSAADEGNSVGGLIGSYGGTTSDAQLGLLNNFSAEKVTNTDASIGGIAGYDGTEGNIPNLTTNYFDPSAAGTADCTYYNDGLTAESCYIADASSFKNSTSNPPLNNWDFEGVWQELNNDFPDLQLGRDAPVYTINSCADLQNINRDLNGNYTLGSDIDCTMSSTWNDGLGFSPIGIDTSTFIGAPFTGTFDGQGHVITGLTEDRSTCIGTCVDPNVGLFNWTQDATIKDFSLRAGEGGQMIGHWAGGAVVTWLIGTNASGINSDTPVTVPDGYYVGGLFGYADNSDNNPTPVISRDYSTGSVVGLSNVGGLIGRSDWVSIENTYSQSNVEVVDGGNYAGGLLGSSDGTNITNSYASGNITLDGSGDYLGGLVGTTNAPVTITNSFAAGGVPFTGNSGGLVGNNYDTLNLVNDSYDANRSGQFYCVDEGDGPDCTRVNAMGSDPEHYLGNSSQSPLDQWDFTNIWASNSGDYPTLTSTLNFYISDCAQLEGINNNLNGHYFLTQDIDCSDSPSFNGGDGFYPIGWDGNFTGTFDGQGYTISNLTINEGGWANVGLFGTIQNSYIHDFNLANTSVEGGENVGAAVGYMIDSKISDVTSDADVFGGSQVGGVVGQFYMDDSPSNQFVQTISNIMTDGTVTIDGGNDIGGVVGLVHVSVDGAFGFGYSNFNNLLSVGDVLANGVSNAGGIVGRFQDNSIDAINYWSLSGSQFTGTVGGDSTANVGGLIGLVDNYSNGITMAGDDSNSTVNGSNNVGGLIGSTQGNNPYGPMAGIYETNVTTEGTINSDGGSSVGGLIGNYENDGDSVLNTESSSSSATINETTCTESEYIGGLIGHAVGDGISSMNQDVFTGTINAPCSLGVGGLIGYQETGYPIFDSYSQGDVTGAVLVGGLVGISDETIDKTYSSGTITGEDAVGGLVGLGNSTISNSFSASPVVVDGGTAAGLVGSLDEGAGATITNSYYDQYRSGVTDCADVTDQCDGTAVNIDNATPEYFINNDSNPPLDQWNFSGLWVAHNYGYPTFTDNTVPGGGSVTATSTQTTITPSWDYSDNGGSDVTGYDLQYRVYGSGDDWTDVTLGSPTDTTATITGLTPGTTYEFQVDATNGAGTSDWLGFTASTQAVPVTTPTPTPVTITSTSTSSKDTKTTNTSGGVVITLPTGNGPAPLLLNILLNDFPDYSEGGGHTVNLSVGQVIYFNVGSQQHSATVKLVGPDYVILTLKSTPMDVKLMVGQTAQYDVTKDGKADIQATLLGINNGQAQLVFSEINTKSVVLSQQTTHGTIWATYLLGGVVIIGIIAIYAVKKRHPNSDN